MSASAAGADEGRKKERTYLLGITGEADFAFEDVDDGKKCRTNLSSTLAHLVGERDPRPRCVGERVQHDGTYRVWVYYDLRNGGFGYEFKSLGNAPVPVPLWVIGSTLPPPRAGPGTGRGESGTTMDCFECPPPYANHAECLVILVGTCLANPVYERGFSPRAAGAGALPHGGVLLLP